MSAMQPPTSKEISDIYDAISRMKAEGPMPDVLLVDFYGMTPRHPINKRFT
jgi:hypothetical protein